MENMATRPSDGSKAKLLLKNAKNEEVEEFIIEKRRACRYSPVLSRAFAIDQRLRFTILDSTKAAVRQLIHWLYKQEIFLNLHQGHDGCRAATVGAEHVKAKACTDEVGTMLNLWVLAGELQIFKLQNETMSKLFVVARKCPAALGTYYNRVYTKTGDGSPLRDFIIQVAAWNENYREFETRPHLFPRDMLLDLTKVYCQALPQGIAARKRQQMQYSFTRFTAKEDSDPSEGPSPQKQQRRLTRQSDMTREIGLDEMLDKFNRSRPETPKRNPTSTPLSTVMDQKAWNDAENLDGYTALWEKKLAKPVEEVQAAQKNSPKPRGHIYTRSESLPGSDYFDLVDLNSSPGKADAAIESNYSTDAEEGIDIAKQPKIMSGIGYHPSRKELTAVHEKEIQRYAKDSIEKKSYWAVDDTASKMADTPVQHLRTSLTKQDPQFPYFVNFTPSSDKGPWSSAVVKTHENIVQGECAQDGESTAWKILEPSPNISLDGTAKGNWSSQVIGNAAGFAKSIHHSTEYLKNRAVSDTTIKANNTNTLDMETNRINSRFGDAFDFSHTWEHDYEHLHWKKPVLAPSPIKNEFLAEDDLIKFRDDAQKKEKKEREDDDDLIKLRTDSEDEATMVDAMVDEDLISMDEPEEPCVCELVCTCKQAG